MQDKFDEFKKRAVQTGKRVMARLRQQEPVIAPYHGKDAFYSDDPKAYEEFLNSVDGKINTAPPEVEEGFEAGEENSSVQKIVEMFRKKTEAFERAAHQLKEEFSMQLKEFKEATEAEEPEEEGYFEKMGEKIDEIRKNFDLEEVKKQLSENIQNNKQRLEEFAQGLSGISENFEKNQQKLDELGQALETVTEEARITQAQCIDNMVMLKELKALSERLDTVYTEVNSCTASTRDTVLRIEDKTVEIHQATKNIDKLSDSVFDLKSSQQNTKNTITELAMEFALLKKKCIVGITILSVLAAVSIAMQAVILFVK